MADHQHKGSSTSGIRLVTRALRHRNYRLFFAGQSVSVIGTWVQQVALGWLVYRVTGSALSLGVVGFASQIPALVMSPFAGVLVDRWNRHRILIGTQSLAMLQAFCLAALTLSGTVVFWHIIVLAVLIGLVNAVDMPARQSFVVEMVTDREDLPNAIALHSSLFNSARLIGPSLAGVVIARMGEGLCFLVNGASYLAVIAALLAMRVAPRVTAARDGHVLAGLKEGFHYAFGSPAIRAVIALLALISFVGMPYSTLMPVFAREVLHGDARTFGLLVSASGVGALAGAIRLASRRSVLGLGRNIAVGACIFGGGLMLLALAPSLWVALPLLVISGYGMMTQMASSNTVIQTIVDEDKRGRVMSFYMLAFVGTAPFGSLLAGSAAEALGVPATFLAGGFCCILGGILFARRLPALQAMVRPIYERLGILPSPVTGVEAATTLTTPPEGE
ncbi:MAG: MFS transporter [Armatimonadetes bacterium]|nr:MFS transporter [Armatimonadota bacterium]